METSTIPNAIPGVTDTEAIVLLSLWLSVVLLPMLILMVWASHGRERRGLLALAACICVGALIGVHHIPPRDVDAVTDSVRPFADDYAEFLHVEPTDEKLPTKLLMEVGQTHIPYSNDDTLCAAHPSGPVWVMTCMPRR